MSYCIQAQLSEYGRNSYLTKNSKKLGSTINDIFASKIIHFKIRVNQKNGDDRTNIFSK